MLEAFVGVSLREAGHGVLGAGAGDGGKHGEEVAASLSGEGVWGPQGDGHGLVQLRGGRKRKHLLAIKK